MVELGNDRAQAGQLAGELAWECLGAFRGSLWGEEAATYPTLIVRPDWPDDRRVCEDSSGMLLLHAQEIWACMTF